MSDYLNSLLAQTDSPLLITCLLSLVFALDPCAMLTNVAAIGYVGKDLEKRKVFFNGLWYTLGRMVAFGVLGAVVVGLLRAGDNVLHISEFFSEYGEIALVPLFILMGIFLFFPDIFPSLRLNVSTDKIGRKISKNHFGSFVLGAVLSLAFCPTNAMIFFGMLLPVCSSSSAGLGLLLIFALVVALPVAFLAWLVAFGVDKINKFYTSMRNAGKWARWIVGAFFMLVGLFFLLEHLLE